MTTLENKAYVQALCAQARTFVDQGLLALAEAYALESLRASPDAREGYAVMGTLGLRYGQPEAAWRYFDKGNCISELEDLRQTYGDPSGALEAMRAQQVACRGKYLVVKAWAYGFWADVFHVLGQALVAEVTGRTIVTDWGQGSLYWHPGDGDLFSRFFAPLSTKTMADVARDAASFYPSKWTARSLGYDFVNQWHGDGALTYALTFLKRTEDVVVSDFFTSVHSVVRWLPSSHPLFGKKTGEVLKYLMQTYLMPIPEITQAVEAFRTAHLDGPTLAVHVRGLDKEPDAPDIQEINRGYHEAVRRCVEEHNPAKILLITDSRSAVAEYTELYGERLVTTDIIRADNERAAPYLKQDESEKKRLVMEVLTDTYLAASCDWFIGNGWSNVSVAVRHLKDWEDGAVQLLGGDMTEEEFFNLYQPREEEQRDRFAIAEEEPTP